MSFQHRVSPTFSLFSCHLAPLHLVTSLNRVSMSSTLYLNLLIIYLFHLLYIRNFLSAAVVFVDVRAFLVELCLNFRVALIHRACSPLFTSLFFSLFSLSRFALSLSPNSLSLSHTTTLFPSSLRFSQFLLLSFTLACLVMCPLFLTFFFPPLLTFSIFFLFLFSLSAPFSHPTPPLYLHISLHTCSLNLIPAHCQANRS